MQIPFKKVIKTIWKEKNAFFTILGQYEIEDLWFFYYSNILFKLLRNKQVVNI